MKKFGVVLAALCVFALAGCNEKKTVKINSAEDLKGLTIGAQSGTTGEAYIQDEIEGATCKSFKTVVDAALALKDGSIDAIVIDELPAQAVCKQNPDLTVLYFDLFTDVYAIAVKKGNSDLLNSINKTIATMKADGRCEKLMNSFMPVDGEIKIPAIEGLKSKDKLRMGTEATFPPFEYVENSKVVGFDVSFAQVIANDYGKELEVLNMNFDSLIAALQSDAVDLVAAGMAATEERRKNVDFSDPYYVSKQVVVVRK